jgi:hypothetical protein
MQLQIRKRDPRIRHLAFLFEAYEPRVYWFEVLECMRRLLLTGMMVSAAVQDQSTI